jgi:hypothetical protein
MPIHSVLQSRSVSVCVLVALALALGGCRGAAQTVTLQVGAGRIVAEVADTEAERSEGLMHRRELPEDRGMLFVYHRDQKLSFWMKDTTIPLSIAFIAADGTVREIHDMKPLSLRPVESRYSVRYALEVRQGTFERLGVEPGDRIVIPEDL